MLQQNKQTEVEKQRGGRNFCTLSKLVAAYPTVYLNKKFSGGGRGRKRPRPSGTAGRGVAEHAPLTGVHLSTPSPNSRSPLHVPPGPPTGGEGKREVAQSGKYMWVRGGDKRGAEGNGSGWSIRWVGITSYMTEVDPSKSRVGYPPRGVKPECARRASKPGPPSTLPRDEGLMVRHDTYAGVLP